MEKLSPEAIKTLFTEARTHSHWRSSQALPVEQLHQLYDLLKFGPTTANSSPARFVFVTSAPAKEKLRAALAPGNIEKTMAAPATAIIAYDQKFYEHLDRLFPQDNARPWFEGRPDKGEEPGRLSATLQGAYLILAARSLGLDCGPMGGFNNKKVDELFFSGTSWRSLFLCNLGHGVPEKLHPRNPRLSFDEACKVL